jgi:Uncharacterized protein conserved in bacteria
MKNKIEHADNIDLKNGYLFDPKTKIYTCLFCNAQYEDGYIYTFDKRLVNAEKAITLHITEKHESVFESLLSTDKVQTGLTDTQKEFLKSYYNGLTDKEIAEKMNISASTVRYQRFNFREKVKQAKMILALSELIESTEKSVTPVDENEQALNTLFDSLSPLVLKTFDFKKNKDEKRNLIMQTITQQFEKGKIYNEKEVNEILKSIYPDFATIRRSLIDYGFMNRTSDCREYKLK